MLCICLRRNRPHSAAQSASSRKAASAAHQSIAHAVGLKLPTPRPRPAPPLSTSVPMGGEILLPHGNGMPLKRQRRASVGNVARGEDVAS